MASVLQIMGYCRWCSELTHILMVLGPFCPPAVLQLGKCVNKRVHSTFLAFPTDILWACQLSVQSVCSTTALVGARMNACILHALHHVQISS